MKESTLPHPADILTDVCGVRACPNTPIGFAAKARFVSTLPVSEIIHSPSNNILKTMGEASATSLISQQDAEEKAEAAAIENARAEMGFIVNAHYPPRGEWIV